MARIHSMTIEAPITKVGSLTSPPPALVIILQFHANDTGIIYQKLMKLFENITFHAQDRKKMPD